MPYIVSNSASGAKTLVFRGERDVRLHSAFDPVRDAQRATADFTPGRKGFIVVLGLGLGYHLKILAERFPDAAIIAVEKDREVVDLVRRECPENISRAFFICSTDDLPSVFEQFDVSGFRGFALFTHRPSYSLDPSFYDAIIVEMNRYVSSKISDLLTRFEFEEKWAANILSNIPHLFKGACVGEFFGAFKGYPGVIVSAGPSLKKNAPLLKELSDKALICCVDTSFKVLTRLGITPHIVMSLDAQRYSVRHFLGIESYEPYLLSDLVSCPRVGSIYRGRLITSTTSKYYDSADGTVSRETTPLMDWVEKYIHGIGDVQSGGSVATSLFDFLLNAGCSSIILVGQDLAYTGREIHTSGTYHNDEWLTLTNRTLNLDTINQRVVRKRKISYVPSWGGGGTVLTDFVLNIYRQWFEDSCGKVGVTVINATEGGARIDGTVEMTLADVSESCSGQKKKPADILDSIYNAREHKNPKPFADALKRAQIQVVALSAFSANPDSADAQAAVRKVLSDGEMTPVFSPFLKKTNAYLNRHPDMDEQKAFSLITREIIRASGILSQMIPACRKEIEKNSAQALH
jgi:hypothetical protein